jgi:septum formation protein
MFDKKLILGSGSPRRKEILSSIWEGEIQVIKSDIVEIYPDNLDLKKIPIYLAKLKGDDLKARVDLTKDVLLTADTIVLCENKVLGKPTDVEDARAMLEFLSNKVHHVHTGVAIYFKNQVIEIEEKTDVYFSKLDSNTIDFYVNKYQPMDKAGSYGIQEFIGMIGIKKIVGCFYNVMGLPANRVWEEMKSLV